MFLPFCSCDLDLKWWPSYGHGPYTIKSIAPLNSNTHDRTGVMGNQILHCGKRVFRLFFASVTLTLTQWPSHTNLTRFLWRYTGWVKRNFVRQVFRKLWYYSLRMYAFSYVWSLPATCQRWWSQHWIHHSSKPIIHINLTALSFMQPKLWTIKFQIAGIWIFDFFAPVTLNLTQWHSHTNLTCMEIHQMGKYELPTSRLSKVIVWQTDRYAYIQTDRQTRPKLNIMPLCRWSKIWLTAQQWKGFSDKRKSLS